MGDFDDIKRGATSELGRQAAKAGLEAAGKQLLGDDDELTEDEKKKRKLKLWFYAIGGVVGVAIIFKLVFSLWWYIIGAGVLGAAGLGGWYYVRPKLLAGREAKREAKAQLKAAKVEAQKKQSKEQAFEDEFAALKAKVDQDPEL